MRRWLCVCAALLLGGILTACGNRETLENTQESAAKPEIHVESSSAPSPAESKEKEDPEIQEESTMKVTVGDTVFTAALADNSSVQALKELLAEGPLTINMRDYGSMEKVVTANRAPVLYNIALK